VKEMMSPHSTPFDFKKAIWIFISYAVVAGSTHTLDAYIVKGRVDAVEVREAADAKTLFLLDEKVSRDEQALAEAAKVDWLMNRRMCHWLIAHGEADPECSQELYQEKMEEEADKLKKERNHKNQKKLPAQSLNVRAYGH
jgi:hypothetical protein